MKIYLYLAICILGIATEGIAGPILKVVCKENLSGDIVDAAFNSSLPIFSSSIMLLNSQKPIDRQYLSEKSVCGTPIEFSKACLSNIVRVDGDIHYGFKCGDNISGYLIYGNETVTFSCKGIDVQEDYQNAFFSGCKLAR